MQASNFLSVKLVLASSGITNDHIKNIQFVKYQIYKNSSNWNDTKY